MAVETEMMPVVSQCEIRSKDIKMSDVNITKMSPKNTSIEGEVTIELGGRLRTLRLDFNALALIEERTGKTLADMGNWTNLSAKHMRSMIWAALVHEDESLTEQQVGRWLTLQAFPIAIKKFSEAMYFSMNGEMPTADKLNQVTASASPLALVTEVPS